MLKPAQVLLDAAYHVPGELCQTGDKSTTPYQPVRARGGRCRGQRRRPLCDGESSRGMHEGWRRRDDGIVVCLRHRCAALVHGQAQPRTLEEGGPLQEIGKCSVCQAVLEQPNSLLQLKAEKTMRVRELPRLRWRKWYLVSEQFFVQRIWYRLLNILAKGVKQV